MSKGNKRKKIRTPHALKIRLAFGSESSEVNLTSMIDMFTIILLFLLKSYSVTDVNLSPPKEIRLPNSVATAIPSLAVKVNMSPNKIEVDDHTVVYLNNGLLSKNDVQGLVIFPLYRELKTIASIKRAEAKENPDEEFKPQIILYGDKNIPYKTLKRVMYTAGQAQYEAFRFSVIRKGRFN